MTPSFCGNQLGTSSISVGLYQVAKFIILTPFIPCKLARLNCRGLPLFCNTFNYVEDRSNINENPSCHWKLSSINFSRPKISLIFITCMQSYVQVKQYIYNWSTETGQIVGYATNNIKHWKLSSASRTLYMVTKLIERYLPKCVLQSIGVGLCTMVQWCASTDRPITA